MKKPEEYLGLVSIIAKRMKRGLPHHIELDDLMSSGTLGLYAAMDAFDQSKGVKFETFATFRIYGAIMDWLRDDDWCPRSLRNRHNKLMAATDKLTQTLGRKPTTGEVADHLGLSDADYGRMYRDCSLLYLGGDEPLSSRPDRQHEEMVASFEAHDLLDSLDDRDRLAMDNYYVYGMSLSEIGESMDMTESGACLMHARAINKMRVKCQE